MCYILHLYSLILKCRLKSISSHPGYGWVVVAGAVLSQLLIFGYGRQFGVFYIHFLEEFHKSAAETAWVGALFQVSSQILGELIPLADNLTYGKALQLTVQSTATCVKKCGHLCNKYIFA